MGGTPMLRCQRRLNLPPPIFTVSSRRVPEIAATAAGDFMQPTNDGLAIDLRDVAKVYKGRVHALQGIEMRVARGEIFGLLGPNGAGKSTLVKIMMTVISPTRAVGTVLGQPVGNKPTLEKVGYLPE